jgi:hypothetical protein
VAADPAGAAARLAGLWQGDEAHANHGNAGCRAAMPGRHPASFSRAPGADSERRTGREGFRRS